MENALTISLMADLLNKDRIEYLEIILNSEEGISSFEIAQMIMKLKDITDEKEVRKENIKVNKRLRKLVDLKVLVSVGGVYSLSNRGYLLLDSWKNLTADLNIMDEFEGYFDIHLVKDIPKDFFLQISKLRNTELTRSNLEWKNALEVQMDQAKRKIYNVTQCIHDFPEKVIEKKQKGEIDIVIIYQFDKYPELNYSDNEEMKEKELFDKLVKAGVEFRYIDLKERHPIGIRAVDEKWATFVLPRIVDGELDRDHVFVGADPGFVSWCRDLTYHMWYFEASELKVEEVQVKTK